MVVVAVATLMTGPIMRLHCAGLKSGAKPPPHWVCKLLLMGSKNASVNYVRIQRVVNSLSVIKTRLLLQPNRRESLRLLQRTWSRRSGHEGSWDGLAAALTTLTQELRNTRELDLQQKTVELWIEVASRLDWVMMIGLLLLLTTPTLILLAFCILRSSSGFGVLS